MSSFCTAKATHIFFSKKFQHICVSLDLNFNELLTNDVVSFEQLGPGEFVQMRHLVRHKLNLAHNEYLQDILEISKTEDAAEPG